MTGLRNTMFAFMWVFDSNSHVVIYYVVVLAAQILYHMLVLLLAAAKRGLQLVCLAHNRTFIECVLVPRLIQSPCSSLACTCLNTCHNAWCFRALCVNNATVLGMN
jgi:hypothetical protein